MASLVLALAAAPLASAGLVTETDMVGPERWVVGFYDPPSLEAGDLYNGARVVLVDAPLRFAAVETLAPTAFAFLTAQDDNVRYLEPDPWMQLVRFTPNDPRYPSMYGPQQIGAPAAWDRTLGSTAAVLCVGDTGVRYTHEDLTGRFGGGFDFINTDADPADDHGHGTHVTGTATASTNNGLGIAGIGQSTYKHAKVLNSGGSGTWSQVSSGIRWCADNGAHVISLSLGGSGGAPELLDAVNYAWNAGVLVVAAAGNSGCEPCVGFPAAYENAMAVACTTSTKALCSFSSRGPEVDIAAPGSSIDSTYVTSDTSYTSLSGTSMSTPHVAGAAVLLKADNPALTNANMRSLLEGNTEDLGAAGWDSSFGHGLVRVDLAIGIPPPPPTVPGAPALAASAGNTQNSLSWTTPSNGGSAITGYNIYRGTTSGGESFLTSVGAVNSYTDTGLTNGVTYFYQVSAVNAVGEGARSNEASATPFAPPAPPYAENFDDGAANGWVLTGLWHVGSGCAAAASPPNYLGYTQESTCTFNNGAANSGTATFDVDLAGQTSATLTFKHRIQGEGGTFYDQGRVQVSTNGGSTWTTLAQYGSTAITTFTQVSLDLTPYVGGNVKVRFFFDTVDGVFNDFLGWLVDDVSVSGDGPPPPPPPGPNPPSAPQSLVAKHFRNKNSGQIKLDWLAPASDGGAAVTNYRIYRGTVSGGEVFLVQVGNVLTYTDSGLTKGVTYYYKVSAVNSAGEGPLSNESSAIG